MESDHSHAYQQRRCLAVQCKTLTFCTTGAMLHHNPHKGFRNTPLETLGGFGSLRSRRESNYAPTFARLCVTSRLLPPRLWGRYVRREHCVSPLGAGPGCPPPNVRASWLSFWAALLRLAEGRGIEPLRMAPTATLPVENLRCQGSVGPGPLDPIALATLLLYIKRN